jgi:hypothetical protein
MIKPLRYGFITVNNAYIPSYKELPQHVILRATEIGGVEFDNLELFCDGETVLINKESYPFPDDLKGVFNEVFPNHHLATHREFNILRAAIAADYFGTNRADEDEYPIMFDFFPNCSEVFINGRHFDNVFRDSKIFSILNKSK